MTKCNRCDTLVKTMLEEAATLCGVPVKILCSRCAEKAGLKGGRMKFGGYRDYPGPVTEGEKDKWQGK